MAKISVSMGATSAAAGGTAGELHWAADWPAPGVDVIVLCEDAPRVRVAYMERGWWVDLATRKPISGLICGWMEIEKVEARICAGSAVACRGDASDGAVCKPLAVAPAREHVLAVAPDDDPEEPCRVRRVRDGKYLAYVEVKEEWAALQWVTMTVAGPSGVYERHMAQKLASAVIALQGDSGIEIEPVAAD